ncbi:MAG: thymidine phosphorylase [Actinomycetales bacterium]
MGIIGEAIETKKVGGELSPQTIDAVVAGYTGGEVPDYQMAALLMAIRLRGMTFAETVALTRAMADSGARYSFPDCVDKHSTGGVGDKLTMTALPLVAACGVPVAKLSGRGLGITGGTIDKLESIPGWSGDLSEPAFRAQVARVGLVVASAGEVAPADKAIYALRDATGTVDSLPLIGSSIVSKKVATGAGHLLYDVKAGSGAFMKDAAAARELADLLVRLSAALGVSAAAVITDMGTPLGAAVGNALEVRESVAFLTGAPVPQDLAEVARYEAAQLLRLHGAGDDADEQVLQAWRSGAGYEAFAAFVHAQGGQVAALSNLSVSSTVTEVTAPQAGQVQGIDALAVARASLVLGAGRQRKEDAIDPGAGVLLRVRVGDRVERADPVATLYGVREVDAARELVLGGLRLGEQPASPVPHLIDTVGIDTVGPARD